MPLMILVAVVQATSETIVKVEPSSSSANVGETFTINITVLDVQNLYSIKVTLYWDSSILEPVNITDRLGETDGVLCNPIYMVENSTYLGEYVLAATSTAPASPFNGSGNVARITFNVTNIGNSALHLETQLYDYPPPDREPPISLPIDHVTIDGSFSIIPEFPNIIILFLFMTLAVFAIIFAKKTRKTRLVTVLL